MGLRPVVGLRRPFPSEKADVRLEGPREGDFNRPELGPPQAEEAQNLAERIGLGVLREQTEALLKELSEVSYGLRRNRKTFGAC